MTLDWVAAFTLHRDHKSTLVPKVRGCREVPGHRSSVATGRKMLRISRDRQLCDCTENAPLEFDPWDRRSITVTEKRECKLLKLHGRRRAFSRGFVGTSACNVFDCDLRH
jgi:hypothetical protein